MSNRRHPVPEPPTIVSIDSSSSNSNGEATPVNSSLSPTGPCGPPYSVPGWPSLAKLMGTKPDFAAFSRFRDLNIKSLLYYQAQLRNLKARLAECERYDKFQGEGGNGLLAQNIDYLVNSPKCPNRSQEQWALILEIRRVLKEYNEALIQYSHVSALPAPDSQNVETLRAWIKRNDDSDNRIQGLTRDTWGDPGLKEGRPSEAGIAELDLVATLPAQSIDSVTRFVVKKFVPFYHRCRNKARSDSSDVESGPKIQPESVERVEDSIESYSERKMLRFTSGVATLIACLLPTLGIYALSKVHSMDHIIEYIAGFTLLFAFGLMCLTNANTSRVEIFTATAAFSAVLVVFVQNAVDAGDGDT